MMRIAVTGQTGQLVSCLREGATQWGVDIMSLGRPAVDLTRLETIGPALIAVRPDVIVSAAAYTAVDRAEGDVGTAFRVNADAAGEIARAAKAMGVPLIHISTDYVFDGNGGAPYAETAETGPVSVYGRSKLAGEKAVQAVGDNHVILRTSWIFSVYGANFVRTMLTLARDRDEVHVVADQHGCPTNGMDIAAAVVTVARQMLEHRDYYDRRGIFHFCGAGATDWASFADAVFDAQAEFSGVRPRVVRIATTDYPTAAVRPPDSRLDTTLIERTFGFRVPTWRDSLPDVVKRLLDDDIRGKHGR
jgi:dTDP-4-dehydrorhamnose reductase